MKGVLNGVRVLDFGRYIAGPYCAALLGDFGADVIRIEKRTGGEDRFQAPISPTGDGALFMQVNRNKRGMTLDPMTNQGRDVVRRLVANADVVVANLPPQTLKAMGLDFETLKSVKSDIILTTVSAYGAGGPYSNRVGFDGVGQAMSGAVYMTAQDEKGPPMRAQVAWVDFGTAVHCAFGTVLAMMARDRTGEAQHVQGALLATALSTTNAMLIEQAVTNINRTPSGNRAQTSAPVDIFPTRDGWILVQVVGDPLFRRWTKLVGEETWADDPRFASDILRGKNSRIISERMTRWCSERTSAEALALLGDAMIPAGPVLSAQQALDDPHVGAVGFLQPVDFPGLAKPAPVSKAAVTVSGAPHSIRTRAPLLGEHTDAILAELGYQAPEISALRDKGVI